MLLLYVLKKTNFLLIKFTSWKGIHNKTLDKTCLKIEKNLVSVSSLGAKKSEMNWKNCV